VNTYEVKLTLTQPILGTVPKDPDIYEGYIASKAALTDEAVAEELATVERVEEKGWTGFHKVEGTPILYDYVIKGFFKDAASMLRRVPDTKTAKIKAYRKIIDGLVFVTPRQIPINLNGYEMGVLERPLRASTAQGERIALARSDTCPVGTTIEFTLAVMGSVSEAVLREWLDYGALRGLGQWRNGGYGTFTYEMSEA